VDINTNTTTVKYAVNEHVHSGRILRSTCCLHAGCMQKVDIGSPASTSDCPAYAACMSLVKITHSVKVAVKTRNVLLFIHFTHPFSVTPNF